MDGKYFNTKYITSKGHRSIVSLAAFYAAGQMKQFSSGMVFNYRDLAEDVMYKEFFPLTSRKNPTGQSEGNELFWNSVEITESVKQEAEFGSSSDIKFAFEINASLPRALSMEDKIALARKFVVKGLVKRQIPADLFCHHGLDDNGNHYPHLHVLLPMKKVDLKNMVNHKQIDWSDKQLIKKLYSLWFKLTKNYGEG